MEGQLFVNCQKSVLQDARESPCSWCGGLVSWQPSVISSFPRSSFCITVRNGHFFLPWLTPGRISRTRQIPGELWTFGAQNLAKGKNNKTKKRNPPHLRVIQCWGSQCRGQRCLKIAATDEDVVGRHRPLKRPVGGHGELMCNAARRTFSDAGQLPVTACFIFSGLNHWLIFQLGSLPHSERPPAARPAPQADSHPGGGLRGSMRKVTWQVMVKYILHALLNPLWFTREKKI